MKDLVMQPALAQRLLEDLIHRRVAETVDLVELTLFERELGLGLDGLLDELGAGATAAAGDAPSRVLAAALIDRAWERVEREWQGLREATSFDPDWCPLCDGLGHDDDHVEHADRERRRAS